MQSLFPLIVPDIIEDRKKTILDLLRDVILYIFRINIIDRIILFLLFLDRILLIILFLLLILCGGDRLGLLPITLFFRG